MTDLISLGLVAGVGTVSGMLTGLLPGIGSLSLMLLLYPWLFNLSVIELFVFYISLMIACQYYGSISAIVYGIPGEITSVPAAHHGHLLFLQGHGNELLAGTSTASWLGSLLALVIFQIAAWNHDFLSLFLDNIPRLLILISMICMILISNQHRIQAMVAVILGLIIGQIGLNEFTNTYVLSSTSFLPNGIPYVALFMGFLVVPELFFHLRRQSVDHSIIIPQYPQWRTRFINLCNINVIRSALHGGIIGSVMGLIPGIGTSFSSTVAAKLESRRRASSDQSIVISAEAANNAASITVLIPFVLLALPIIPSEAFLMSLAERQGFGINMAYHALSENLLLFMMIMLITNTCNWLISGIFFHRMAKIFVCMDRFIYPVLIMLCLAICCVIGLINNQILMTVVVTVMATLAGIFVKHQSVRLALVFAALLSDLLFSEIYRFFLFHFL